MWKWCDMEVIFIKDPGVLGFISRRYPTNVVQAKYYLDGIMYSVVLDVDEWSEFSTRGEHNER